MILGPLTLRVQVGQAVEPTFSSTVGGDATWAVDASSDVTWLTFADTAEGVMTGEAPATGGSGRLVVSATIDGDVERGSCLVDVLPAGFQAVYEPVTAPVVASSSRPAGSSTALNVSGAAQIGRAHV